MLRSLLKGIRHLQCGTHNAVPTQILPITGYYLTRLQHSDSRRFRPTDSVNDSDDDYEDDRSYRKNPSYNRFASQYGSNRNHYENRPYRQYQGNNRMGGYGQKMYGNQQRNQQRYNAQDLFDLEPVDWTTENLSECKRVEYSPHDDTANRSSEEVEAYREANQIKISGTRQNPIQSFDETNFCEETMQRLKRNGWEKPTPIQAETWPVILSNQNLVGICHTGSGKTLCYILPALEHIRTQQTTNTPTFKRATYTYSPFVLVLVPTRELAIQVLQVVEDFTQRTIKTVATFGGVKDHWYFSFQNQGVDMCIATPGRLLALLKDNKIDLKNCTYLVVDEADTMLDMGFEQSVKCIMNQCRPDRQLLMWTATWAANIQDLAHSYLQKHAVIHIGSSNQTPNENITQNFTVCEEEGKMEGVLDILTNIRKTDQKGKAIVFANTRQSVETVYYTLRKMGMKPLMLHGPMAQLKRQLTIKEFMRTRGAVLVATDVASRGLDIEGVDYVINYDFPPVVKTYVHRIGRCGRKDIRGTSFTFFTDEDRRLADELIELLEESKQEVPPEIQRMSRRTMNLRGRNRRY